MSIDLSEYPRERILQADTNLFSESTVRQIVADAVKAEREACETIADDEGERRTRAFEFGCAKVCYDIAEAIHARQ